MLQISSFDVVQMFGWVLLGLSLVNMGVQYKEEKKKILVGMLLSFCALIVFLLNLFFNIK